MFFSEHRLKIASLRIGKHRIVKNIASLRKVNIAHPYLYQRVSSVGLLFATLKSSRADTVNNTSPSLLYALSIWKYLKMKIDRSFLNWE